MKPGNIRLSFFLHMHAQVQPYIYIYKLSSYLLIVLLLHMYHASKQVDKTWTYRITLRMNVYCHPQRICSVESQLFSEARYMRYFKLGLKPTGIYDSPISYPKAIIFFSVVEGIFILMIFYTLSAQLKRRTLHLRVCGSLQFFIRLFEPQRVYILSLDR